MAPAARRDATLVVDLGFGDAGKGAVTDRLVRERRAHTVVRFNGGAQAGHNVVTPDGRHHTFSQLGSGSFVPGVRTHLADATVVHPTALLVEAEALSRAGVPDALDRLTVSEAALVVTPFHQAAGRLRELGRGADRHGSCGVGVGEAVRDALAGESDVVRMRDIADLPALRRSLERTRDRKCAELDGCGGDDEASSRERSVLRDPGIVGAWIDAVRPLTSAGCVVDDAWLGRCLAEPGAVVFEGAQGVLLDQDLGFHPFTTWSQCTFEGATRLLDRHGYDGARTRVGVLRTYCVRHGPGPLPTETHEMDAAVREPHNPSGPWQGPFRRGWADLVLTRYALAASPADTLAITHLDALLRATRWSVCTAYVVPACDAAGEGICRVLPVPHEPDLDHQRALTRAVQRARPVLTHFAPGAGADERWCSLLTAELGVAPALGFYGPRASDARRLRPG